MHRLGDEDDGHVIAGGEGAEGVLHLRHRRLCGEGEGKARGGRGEWEGREAEEEGENRVIAGRGGE